MQNRTQYTDVVLRPEAVKVHSQVRCRYLKGHQSGYDELLLPRIWPPQEFSENFSADSTSAFDKKKNI